MVSRYNHLLVFIRGARFQSDDGDNIGGRAPLSGRLPARRRTRPQARPTRRCEWVSHSCSIECLEVTSYIYWTPSGTILLSGQLCHPVVTLPKGYREPNRPLRRKQGVGLGQKWSTPITARLRFRKQCAGPSTNGLENAGRPRRTHSCFPPSGRAGASRWISPCFRISGCGCACACSRSRTDSPSDFILRFSSSGGASPQMARKKHTRPRCGPNSDTATCEPRLTSTPRLQTRNWQRW
jgi:hypothetical protein